MGTQYDRLQIAQLCDSATDLCRLSWAGMIVTDPVHTTIDDEAVVILPTFNTDQSHPAGLVALKTLEINGQPQFQRFWQFPSPDQPDAIKWFRRHPSLPVLSTHLGRQPEPMVWIVDIGTQGKLFGIRAKDGQVLAEQDLQGTGRQLSMPLIIGNQLYMPQTGEAILEAYRIENSQSQEH